MTESYIDIISNIWQYCYKAKIITLKNAPKGAKVTWSTENSKIAKVEAGEIIEFNSFTDLK